MKSVPQYWLESHCVCCAPLPAYGKILRSRVCAEGTWVNTQSGAAAPATVRPVLVECAARGRGRSSSAKGVGRGRPGRGARTGPPPLGGGQAATARGSAGGRQSGSNSWSESLGVLRRSHGACARRARPARHLATAGRHANTGRVLEHQLAGHTERCTGRVGDRVRRKPGFLCGNANCADAESSNRRNR